MCSADCNSQGFTTGLSDTEETRVRETAAYMAHRNLFAKGLEMERSELSLRFTQFYFQIHEHEEHFKRMNEDSLMHPPEFVIKPRSHTVWEKQCVRLHCTVSGWPDPRVIWYKNNVAIDPITSPGKYKLESRYSVHSLEINKCDFDDTAQYRVSAMNSQGEQSAFASIVVKIQILLLFCLDGPISEYGITFQTHIVDKFGVSFGREGETMSLGCTVIIYPALHRYQPEIQWYRDDVLLTPSKWTHVHWSGDRATLTLTHLNKEDEGLYTLRVITKSGYETYSAYVFVRDADAEVEGAPGAPLDVRCLDANKDYIIVAWKQPAVDGGNPIVGYFVDRSVNSWQRVNTELPVKSPRFALFDLAEGKSYHFRVRCCNAAGVGEPSEPTEATTVGDNSGFNIPSAPGKVVPTRNTDTSVVVSWEGSSDAKELVGYYIEASVVDSDVWEPCNNKPVKATRFICHGLVTGEQYVFRVRAVNAAGLSQFSPVSEPVEVKAAIASPAPPYGISVLECVRDSMVLAWKQPTFIGGADITGYFVDYREVIDGVPGKWHEANIKAVIKFIFFSNLRGLGFSHYWQQIDYFNLFSLSNTPFFHCTHFSLSGPPHDLQITEVRGDSLVLLWKPPVYQGRDPINGFYIDIKEADAPEEAWRGVNTKAVEKQFIKVEGETYVFRVRAQNKAGVGKASDVTEPIPALTKPGTKEIVVEVDDEGVISLNFECCDTTPDSKFVWSKNYEEITESSRLTIETKANKSKTVFNTPGEEDIGIYSCLVTHTDGASSSYTFSTEELKRLLEISHDHKFPIIPLKSELAVELLEKGRVRFWLQAEQMSANGKIDYVFNDNVISQSEKYKMNFDKNSGIIEMVMESLTPGDEGTFTFQLKDGKATNQSSLVLIGDVFKQLQKESEFQRKEYFRKQGRDEPFLLSEHKSVKSSPRCSPCQVGNIKKDTSALWSKDKHQIKADEQLGFTEGVLKLEIAQISKKDSGVYEVVLKDDRGQDTSTLSLVDQGFKDLMNEVFSYIAKSSTPLKITSTDEGIRLYTFVKSYSFSVRDSAIAFSDRIKSGVVGEQLWLQINDPTEKDTGKYAIEFNDGKGGLQRTVELSGQAFDDAFAEFQRLKNTYFFPDRARVAGGLPDVVTIQEGKALNLTCNISGNPVPEVTWLKNDREITSDEHCILKFESGKFASFTITAVNTSHSGKYSILVKNKYGTESGDFTVSVFIPEEAAVTAERREFSGKCCGRECWSRATLPPFPSPLTKNPLYARSPTSSQPLTPPT
uniref:Myomesin 1b n=1 Tax=Oryzias latipes TaxID=8090 RepID=A0A3P9M095_ORYLA